MAAFLSPDWVAALDTAARTSNALAECARPGRFVLEQRVALPNGDEWVHHLSLTADSARVLVGAADRADVVLSTDLATAIAIARGESNAQQALAVGRLQVHGDVEALAQRVEALAGVDDLFAAVRAETTFPCPEDDESPPVPSPG